MQFAKNCITGLLNEFKFSNFSLEHKQLEQFYRSQWQRAECSVIYLIYRWIWALSFIGIFVACLVFQFSDGKYFIFLTNWGIMLCTTTQLLAAMLVTSWHYNCAAVRAMVFNTSGSVISSNGSVISSNSSGSGSGSGSGNGNGNMTGRSAVKLAASSSSCCRGLVKLYWLLHGVTLTLALVITTVYWAFLHGKMNKPVAYPVLSFITHCLNSVLMLVDFFIVAFPVRLLHAVYAMMLPITFCLFTVIYFFCDGLDEYGNHYVYPILDWRTPVRGIITFAGVFSLYVVYAVVLFAVYQLRCLLDRTLRAVWPPPLVGMI